jgi:hypothetical protein
VSTVPEFKDPGACRKHGPYAGICIPCTEEQPPALPTSAKFDEIKKPAHYNRGKVEVWDFILDQGLEYLDGCAMKYIARHRHKGTPVKDLKKAIAYLERRIREIEEAGGKAS